MGGEEKENMIAILPNSVVAERGAEVFYGLVSFYWPEHFLGINKG